MTSYVNKYLQTPPGATLNLARCEGIGLNNRRATSAPGYEGTILIVGYAAELHNGLWSKLN